MVTSHVAADRNRRENRLRAGMCYKCGINKHLPNIQICERCQLKAKAYHRKRYTPKHRRTGPAPQKRTRIADSDVPEYERKRRLVRRIRHAFWGLGYKRAEVIIEFASLASAEYVCGVIDYRIEAGVEDVKC